jgi:hypothetical protein
MPSHDPTTIPVEAAIAAVDEEPELPGEMPDDLWEKLKNDRNAMERTLQNVVWLTKEAIKARLLALG